MRFARRNGLRALAVMACAGFIGVSQQAAAQQPHRHHPAPHHPPAASARTAPTNNAAPSGRSNRVPDSATARRGIAGGSTVDDVALGAETPELRALREAERELFPPSLPAPSAAWPSELGSPLAATEDSPRVHASGLPPAPPRSTPPAKDGAKDLSWLAQLKLPDMPVRWDPRVVRYLEFFKDDPRGRATFAHLYKRSGRYRDVVKRALRKKGLPEDLLWVAMVESGFDPTVRSAAGALGLWQFMPDAGKTYGLQQDRWLDQRLSPQAASEAAADFLSDLYRRFTSWDLALASYNMGYGGMAAIVRRFNTNDFWALAHVEGSMPWETTLYVPKILAMATVARNLAAFGFQDAAIDAAVEYEEVLVPPGTPLGTVAGAASCTPHEVELLNPELRAGRTPPAFESAATTYAVKVPPGKAAAVAQNLSRQKADGPLLERYVVRFGETLDQIAAARRVPAAKLVELNGIGPGEVVRGGTVLLVPPAPQGVATTAPPPAGNGQKPVVIVPADAFSYPDKQRVFYRVLVGDTIKEIAASLEVTIDELRRWNNLDPSARLIEGMTVQAFVPKAADLSRVVVIHEAEAHVLAVGSDEFFAHLEAQKGMKRITVTARAGETIETIGKRYQLPARTMERINRRSRTDVLKEGEVVVLYVPVGTPGSASHVTAQNEPVSLTPAARGPVTNGALPPAPAPDLLPPASR
jgi:membrane-bound lytic murein transglycosylase D